MGQPGSQPRWILVPLNSTLKAFFLFRTKQFVFMHYRIFMTKMDYTVGIVRVKSTTIRRPNPWPLRSSVFFLTTTVPAYESLCILIRKTYEQRNVGIRVRFVQRWKAQDGVRVMVVGRSTYRTFARWRSVAASLCIHKHFLAVPKRRSRFWCVPSIFVRCTRMTTVAGLS